MDCLGHNWFTGARKQETVLVHRLTEADSQVPRGCLGAHCCQRDAQCVMLVCRGTQETILWAQVSPGWWVGDRRE